MVGREGERERERERGEEEKESWVLVELSAP